MSRVSVELGYEEYAKGTYTPTMYLTSNPSPPEEYKFCEHWVNDVMARGSYTVTGSAKPNAAEEKS